MRTLCALTIGLAMVIASGCAQRADWIQETLVTVDVTGVWKGTAHPTVGVGGNMEMSLKQRGPKVTGEYRLRIGTGPIEGTVSGDVFTFSHANGLIRGEATVDGDEMSGKGVARGFSNGDFKLRLQRQPRASGAGS